MKIHKLLAVSLIVFLVTLIPYKQTIKSENRFPTKLYVSCDILDFYRWSKNTNPTLSFIISNSFEGTLEGELIPSATWIKLSDTSFDSNLKEITVNLDISNLPPGLYKEKIEIKSNGGDYTLPVRLDLVEKKVVIQMFIADPIVIVDSKQTKINFPPFIIMGLTYVPLRIICESFGANVTFEYVGKERLKVINIQYKDKQVQLLFNRNYMIVNGINQNIAGPVTIRESTTFVPLTIIKEIFKLNEQYNDDFRMLTIIY